MHIYNKNLVFFIENMHTKSKPQQKCLGCVIETLGTWFPSCTESVEMMITSFSISKGPVYNQLLGSLAWHKDETR